MSKPETTSISTFHQLRAAARPGALCGSMLTGTRQPCWLSVAGQPSVMSALPVSTPAKLAGICPPPPLLLPVPFRYNEKSGEYSWVDPTYHSLWRELKDESERWGGGGSGKEGRGFMSRGLSVGRCATCGLLGMGHGKGHLLDVLPFSVLCGPSGRRNVVRRAMAWQCLLPGREARGGAEAFSARAVHAGATRGGGPGGGRQSCRALRLWRAVTHGPSHVQNLWTCSTPAPSS